MNRPFQPLVTVGVNTYPDGIVHVLPYTFGVRSPKAPDPNPTSPDSFYNKGFGEGSYAAATRVGTAGLIVGALAGILGVLIVQRLSRNGGRQ